MSLSSFFGANLTSYTGVELWITRSCLLISASIIGPTVILILLDLCLYIIRAGHGPSTELLRRSKSGIDNLHQRARRRSRSNSATSSAGSTTGIEMTSTGVPSKRLGEDLKAVNDTPITLEREETHPTGGVSNAAGNRQTGSVSKEATDQGLRTRGTSSESPLTALNLGKVIT